MASAVKIVTALSSSKSSPSILSARRRSKFVCEVVPQISPPKDNVARVSRNFGRLKVQRVKEIVKESYMKREQNVQLEDDVDDESKDEVSPSHKETDTLDVLQKVRSRFSRSIDTSGERKLSSSKFSVDSSKGWGGVPSVDTYRPTTDHISKKWTKLKASGDFFSIKSFKEVGCGEHVIESLNKLQYVRPSHIQAMAFKKVLEGKSCIVADQSGSGKTLAYLAPLMQCLRQEELEGLSKAASQCPRVIVLVPTAELASQVLSVCRSLSKAGVPVRSMVATGGFRQKTQLENLREEIDVVIATPGRFMFLVKEGFVQLTNLRSVVLDEVDILYNDEDFELALNSLVNSAPLTAQYIFVTATLPVDIYYKLVEVFPDCEVIMGPGVHRTSPRLQEFLVDCSGANETERTPESAFLNKKNALVQLVGESQVAKTIVFCNKIETCRKVENVLKRLDRKGTSLKVLPFHAALEQDSRLANMEEFRKSSSNNTSMILVCTDRASRGIDFSGVDHVVLFDFPRDPSEYVRRVGRTARGASGEGKAFIFAVGKQVSLARRIIERNQKGHPLHDVPSAYELTR